MEGGIKIAKVMLIGGIQSGKSTLTEKLLSSDIVVVKTQALNYRQWIIDTPGEYTENPLYYKAIMATALEVSTFLLIQDSTKSQCVFPHGFVGGINKKLIGVLTKADHPKANLEKAEQLLRQAIPKVSIVITSSYTGLGIKELLTLINHDGRV